MPSARPPARGSLPGARPAWYAERPRGHRASRGPDAARCPAPHSPHRIAAPGPGECLVAAGTLPHDCRAGRPGTPRAAGPGQAAPGRAHGVLVGVPLPGSLLLRGAAAVPAVGALEALERPPGAAAPHATAHAPCPGNPRRRRQSRQSGRCAPARASCAGGRSRGMVKRTKLVIFISNYLGKKEGK